MRRSIGILAVMLALGAVLAPGSGAAVSLVPLGGEESPLLFDQPIFLTSDPGDPERLLVAERDGRVQEVVEGEATLYADLTELVSCCSGERGLFSIAPAPDFALSGRLYAAYSGAVAAGGALGDLHVDAFVPTGEPEGDVARVPILSIDHLGEPSHYGGQLQFGPDGYLYVSTGDAGGTLGGDPFEEGQDVATLLGKILRIEPLPEAASGDPTYASPAGNPFAGATPGADEVWAYGLRNPWRFSFDRLTGNMLIGDVGQAQREEIDLAISPAPGVVGGKGANYGWNCREGLAAYPDPADLCGGVIGFTDPILDYSHADPPDGNPGCLAVTGGYVARDGGLPDLYGRYLYADFCAGQIRSLDPSNPSASDRNEGLNPAPNPAPNPVSFGEDSCGRIYVVPSNQKVLQLVGDGGPDCTPFEPPAEQPPARKPIGFEKGPDPIRYVLRLKARRDRERVRARVTVGPCETARGLGVQLNRGGRKIGLKPLGSECAVRFDVREAGRSSFRAILVRNGEAVLRSKAARVAAAPR